MPQSAEMYNRESHQEEVDIAGFFDVSKIKSGYVRFFPVVLFFILFFGGIATWYAMSSYNKVKATAILSYKSDIGLESSGIVNLFNMTSGSVLEVLTLPSQLRAAKAALNLDMTDDELEQMLSVSLTGDNANLIQVNVDSTDPVLAMDVANTIAELGVKAIQSANKLAWQGGYAYLKDKEGKIREEITLETIKIANFRQKNRAVGERFTDLSQIADREKEWRDADIEYKKMLVEYNNLKREYNRLPDMVPATTTPAGSMAYKIQALEANLLDLQLKYAPNNPKIKVVEEQIKDFKAKAATEGSDPLGNDGVKVANPQKESMNIALLNLQAKLRSSLYYRDELRANFDLLEKQLLSNTKGDIEFAEMMSKRKLLEEELQDVQTKQNFVESQIGISKSNIEIFRKAIDTEPVWKLGKATLIIAFGTILGFILGSVLVVIVEVTDGKLRTAKQVESLCHLPCLCTVTVDPQFDPRVLEEKGLYYMRTIEGRLDDLVPNWKVLAFTSSNANEGKSSFANLLSLYSKRLGKNTILVSLDNHLAEGSKSNFVSYLQGKMSLDEVIVKGNVDRISIREDASIKERIKDPKFIHMWDELKGKYEAIIVDLPGVLEQTYVPDIIKMSDASIFVINSNDAVANYVEESMEILNQYSAHCTGLLLNMINPIYANSESERKAIRRAKGVVNRK
jgi:uncharacterized protein involved in exopolysaccharide biosynthesis/MinD-like ATPase involved in chromosome partitioning or flagellar assembly